FYKEIGTDFNNGIFKYICGGESKQGRVLEDHVTDSIKEPPNINVKKKGKSLLHSQRETNLVSINEKTVRTLNGERRTVFVMKKKRFAHVLLLTLSLWICVGYSILFNDNKTFHISIEYLNYHVFY